MLHHPDLAQRAAWILEALYLPQPDAVPLPDPVLTDLVCSRLGAPAPDQWPLPRAHGGLAGLLAEHGRQVCHAEHPRCGACELRKFCAHYRAEQQAHWHEDESPTVVDLFCGAGGASLGFTQAGFKLLAAVDVDDRALLTLGLNHAELPSDRVIRQDLFELDQLSTMRAFKRHLQQLLGGERVNVVVGGPPCQGFSLVGKTGRASARSARRGALPEVAAEVAAAVEEPRFRYDPRNRLYRYFLLLVRWLQPDFVAMENVPPLIRIGGSRIRNQVEADLRRLGYRSVHAEVYNCADFGVPQERHRAIFLAARTPGAAPGGSRETPVTLGEAIRDLPPLAANSGHEVVLRSVEPAHSYARQLAAGTRLVHNHVARPHQATDLELYSQLRPGERIKDRPDLQHLNNYARYAFSDIYKRQAWDKPSSTVIAHLAKDGNMFIHPDQVRTYTVREAARVQSFPDDYIFCGPRTAQFRQVGNAIPPLFMQRWAELIATLLGHRTEGDQGTTQLKFF